MLLAAAMVSCAAGPPRDPREGSVTKRDFFFYSCVHEYMQANAIRNFDGSVAYAVEYSRMSGEELNRIYIAATAFAKSIGAPDYSDTEHGLPAVLVACEREAKSFE
jgi:hypothetical protein